MKKCLICAWALVLLLSLVGCAGGIDTKQADQDMESFFQAVSAGDFTAAQKYMHPSAVEDMQSFFDGMEKQNSALDFQNGLTWERENSFEYAMYHSSVGGSRYVRSFRLQAGAVILQAEVVMVSNDAGYGIYSLNINSVQ